MHALLDVQGAVRAKSHGHLGDRENPFLPCTETRGHFDRRFCFGHLQQKSRVRRIPWEFFSFVAFAAVFAEHVL